MATFRLNAARIRGCPPPAKVAAALSAFGLGDDEFGVLDSAAAAAAVFATVIRRVNQTVQRIDTQTKELAAETVEKVQVYPFGLYPSQELLEVYAGSATALEQLAGFLAGPLGLPVAVEPIELDVLAAVEKLAGETQRFQLRSTRLTEYAHSSYVAGPYAPKFMDSEHGREFMERNASAVVSAAVRFAGQSGRVNAHISAKACFSFACAEEDRHAVQAILRKLL